MMEGLSDSFQEDGYEVGQAFSKSQATREFYGHSFDLVFLQNKKEVDKTDTCGWADYL